MSQNGHGHTGTSYITLIIVWIGLLALTSITVSVAGLNLGAYTMFVALLIASIKSYLVVSIFMHIKYEEKIFKLFLLISGFTLVVIFALTFSDIIYR